MLIRRWVLSFMNLIPLRTEILTCTDKNEWLLIKCFGDSPSIRQVKTLLNNYKTDNTPIISRKRKANNLTLLNLTEEQARDWVDTFKDRLLTRYESLPFSTS